MPSMKGSMAPSIIDSDAVQGETFLLGQIFVFGGFVLRANSHGHLEQIDGYALGHQVASTSRLPCRLGRDPVPAASAGLHPLADAF